MTVISVHLKTKLFRKTWWTFLMDSQGLFFKWKYGSVPSVQSVKNGIIIWMWVKWSIGNKNCNHPKWYNFSVALSISTAHIRLPYCFSKNATFFLEDFRCFLWSLLIFNWLLIFEPCCEFLKLPWFAGKNTFCCSSSCSPKSNIFVLVRFWSRIVSLTICFFLLACLLKIQFTHILF